ncbi:MAG: hypothetical protein HEQ39_13460 [Rhizobacter sp.]
MTAPELNSKQGNDEVLHGQTALLKLVSDACIAAGTIGALSQAESLRHSLRQLSPQYDGHLAHYVFALIDRQEFALAEKVLKDAPSDGPYHELVTCSRGVFLLMSQRSGWKEIFEKLRSTAADPQVRQAAITWLELTREDNLTSAA